MYLYMCEESRMLVEEWSIDWSRGDEFLEKEGKYVQRLA